MACVYQRLGSPMYYMRYQLRGVRVQCSTGTTSKGEALKILRAEVRSARSHRLATPSPITFRELCRSYVENHLPSLSSGTQLNYRGHIEVMLETLGHLRLNAIDNAALAHLRASLLRRRLKSCTVRRYLTTLSSIFTHAVVHGMIEAGRLPKVDKRALREARPRDRHLTREEYWRLYQRAAPHLQPIIELAVETGMRLNEVLGLRWASVDLDRREVRLEVTKNNQTRTVPLSDAAVAVLAAAERASEFVFTNPNTGTRYCDVWHAFRRACERADLEDFRFHDLRHTFASWAVQSGMDLYRLSKILGHSNVSMTSRYAHLSTQHLHEAVRLMQERQAPANAQAPLDLAALLAADLAKDVIAAASGRTPHEAVKAEEPPREAALPFR